MNKLKITGHICMPTIYDYDGWFFEHSKYMGFWPLKKNGDPRKRAGDKFYKMLTKFLKLSDKKKKELKISGGCIHI